MKLSCVYNMGNCCVKLKFSDGSVIVIDNSTPLEV